MQEYDIALKLLLKGSARLTVRELTGSKVEKWLDLELPKVQNLRMDLLGQTADGGLVHLEVQTRNDHTMPLRMAEYANELLDAYLFVEDANVLYAEYAANGVEFTRELANTPWRSREFVVKDCDSRPASRRTYFQGGGA